jgi:hypothetical protein
MVLVGGAALDRLSEFYVGTIANANGSNFTEISSWGSSERPRCPRMEANDMDGKMEHLDGIWLYHSRIVFLMAKNFANGTELDKLFYPSNYLHSPYDQYICLPGVPPFFRCPRRFGVPVDIVRRSVMF